jgi:hypothetical protein
MGERGFSGSDISFYGDKLMMHEMFRMIQSNFFCEAAS